MGKADEILKGAIDMHCHGFPEFSMDFPNRYSSEDTVKMMIDSGMSGVVFKSHFYPTTSMVYYLSEKYPDFNIFSSITLNASAGGCNTWTVEAAHKLGAKVVYLPTWSAKNDQNRNSVCRLIGEYLPRLSDFTEKDAYSMCDENGKVYDNIREIMDYVKAKDMVLFTGHISPNESIALAKEAKEMSFKKLVVNHPDSGSVKANIEQVKVLGELGAYIEICSLGITPMYFRLPLDEMKNIIRMVGAEKCILTTDYFFEWSSSVPEQLRQTIATLLLKGVTEGELRKMTSENQRWLLGL